MRIVRDADAAWHGDSLKARGDVDTVAENIVVVDDDVADVNADPKLYPQFRQHVGVSLNHRALDLYRAARRIDGTGELDQHAIAGGLDNATAMRGDLGIDQRFSERLELRERVFLVATHQQ